MSGLPHTLEAAVSFPRLHREAGAFGTTMKIFMFRGTGRAFKLEISKEGRSVKALP